jgi:hypothetical protein
MHHHPIPFVLTLAAAAAAQSFTYSPSVAPTQNGNSNNVYPLFFATSRYQQVHGDLRGAPRALNEIAWRRSGTGPITGAVARTLDCELWIGNGDYATSSTVFATNFTSAPVNAIVRRMVNVPDNTAPNTNPPLFNVTFPFDAPWVYVGTTDLTWELVTHANTSTQSYILDAHNGSEIGAQALSGTACLASGQTARMQQSAVFRSIAWNNTLQLSWAFFNAPAAQPAAVLVGATSADLPVPGLCTNLYVGNIFLTLTGVTSGTSFGTPTLTIPSQPAYVGAQLWSQGAVADPGQAGIPFALTQRHAATVPAPPGVAGPARRIYATSPVATTGGTETYPFWLVTRFKH